MPPLRRPEIVENFAEIIGARLLRPILGISYVRLGTFCIWPDIAMGMTPEIADP